MDADFNPIQNAEKYQPIGKSSQKTASSISPIATGTIRTVADLFAAVKRMDADFNPNPVSGITNKDGTPKVMYHGSPAQFTIFDKKKAKSSGQYGRGFYFTDSQSHAREFAKIDANAKQILADMFVDMSIDAGEKLSTIKAAGLSIKNTAPEGGRQYKMVL